MVARICNKLAGCFKTVCTIPFHISGVFLKYFEMVNGLNGECVLWSQGWIKGGYGRTVIWRTDGYMADGRMDNTFCSICVNMTFKSMIPFG